MRVGWARWGRMASCMITSTFLYRLRGSWRGGSSGGCARLTPRPTWARAAQTRGTCPPPRQYLVLEKAKPHQLEGLLVLLRGRGWGCRQGRTQGPHPSPRTPEGETALTASLPPCVRTRNPELEKLQQSEKKCAPRTRPQSSRGAAHPGPHAATTPAPRSLLRAWEPGTSSLHPTPVPVREPRGCLSRKILGPTRAAYAWRGPCPQHAPPERLTFR